MKNFWTFALILMTWGPVWAQDQAPLQVHKPYFLRDKDKAPNINVCPPNWPLEDSNSQILEIENNIAPPDFGVMDQLTEPILFEKILKMKKVETTLKRFYWHRAGILNYCHLQDLEGNHWYGWVDDGGFNWVLWRGHRFWWKDPFAHHWLYYFQGYWWREDGQTRDSIQVCLDGEYYECNKEGEVMSDMGEDGNGRIVSAPGRYQGDFRKGGFPSSEPSQGGEGSQAPVGK